MGKLGAVDDLDQVLTRLAVALGEVTAGPTALAGGITNRNYRVRFGERDCVVRLPGKDTSLLGISRQAERIATQAAAELGLSPRLVAADERSLVTEYVEAPIGDATSVRAAPEPIAQTLRRFHDSGAELPIRFWVPDLLDAYAGVVHDRGGRLPGAYRAAHELAHRIGRALPLSRPVPCHNDLLPANVLHVRDRGIMLVDWEYAGMGHRMFDVANLAAGAGLDEREESRLLAAYVEREPSRADHAALRLMRIMSDAREAAWGVAQRWISDLDFDFAAYADRHFTRIAAAASDPRLQEWLDAAAA